jgi:hypothetical protein
MSLNWNIKQVADMDAALADTATGWPVTDSLIWYTMIVGMNSITEKNAQKFYARVWTFERVEGPIRGSGTFTTADDVRRLIGLQTNASTLTDHEWRRKVERIVERHTKFK